MLRLDDVPDRAARRAWLREAGFDLAALVWPTSCAGCAAPDRDLCGDCRALITHKPPEFIEAEIGGVPVYARARYGGALRGAIVAYKHGGKVGFSRVLGAALAGPLGAALTRSVDSELAIVTAPSRAASARKRGYRHLDLVVREALKQSGAARPAVLRALRATRGRGAQAGSSAEAREVNAARVAVRAGFLGALRGREVVLVDDVLTTGATLRASAECLRAAGASVVAIAVLGLVRYEGTDAIGNL